MLIFEADSKFIYWHYAGNTVPLEGSFTLDHSIPDDLTALIEKTDQMAYILPNGMCFFQNPVTPLLKQHLMNIKECARVFPQENQLIAGWIEYCFSHFASSEMFLLCETSFFKDIPEEAKYYALPGELANAKIQRFGTDGICHHFSILEAAKVLGTIPKRICSIHLTDFSNIASIIDGRPVDTTAGFSRYEGLSSIHGSGEVDPSITLDLIQRGYSCEEVRSILTEQSGLSALQGNDLNFREFVGHPDRFNKFATEVFIRQIIRGLGSSFAAMSGCDLMIWTVDNIVESYAFILGILNRLQFLGIQFINCPSLHSSPVCITTQASKIQVIFRNQNRWQDLEKIIQDPRIS